METTLYPLRVCRLASALVIFLMCFSTLVFSQSPPLVTTRFANPVYDCVTDQYCLDVEFISPDSLEVFGMNVRFFYDDSFMELIGFSDFQGGYGPVSPNPPVVTQTVAGPGTTNFGFPPPGVADFVNGAIQLVDVSQPPIILDAVNWSKLYQVCFTIEGT